LFFFFFNKTTWMRVFSQINNCQQKQNKSKKQTKQKGGLRFSAWLNLYIILYVYN